MARTVEIIGAPTDFGTDRRGVDMGPSAIRYAGLLEHLFETGIECVDTGDLFPARIDGADFDCGPARGAEDPDHVDGDSDSSSDSSTDRSIESVDGHAERTVKHAERTVRHVDEIADSCAHLADRVAAAISAERLPLVLGGDHSIAIGTMDGASRQGSLGVLWFDAHGDFNTPATSPSGNVHGMALAAALGRGEFSHDSWAAIPTLSEENVALVGVRDLDDGERDVLRESDVTVYTMSDIDNRGATAVVADALDVATDGVTGLHVSLDLDWLDPNEAPGVGTPVRGGVTYREAHAALELVAERDERDGILRSLDLVEVNPILDERNETATLATELAASALGKRIL